jgi:hypothetical protein
MEKAFLNAGELAQRWGIKRKTVYLLKSKIPHYKFKGSIRFKMEDVLAYEEKQKVKESDANGTTS